MIIVVNKWFCRLGNNIMQIKNILHIALYYNYGIQIPNHPLFEKHIINNVNSDCDKNVKLTDKNNFFNLDNSKFDNIIFEKNNEKVIEIMKKSFKIKNVKPLNENDLVIYIRSGDIFSARPHEQYIMPPLSYYIKILSNHSYDKIILVSQDRKNPVINELLKLYPNIIYNKNNLVDDIKIILSARTIVECFGTFSPELLQLSDNIVEIIRPSYQYTTCTVKDRVKLKIIPLNEYRKLLTPWRNTPYQRDLMLKYKID